MRSYNIAADGLGAQLGLAAYPFFSIISNHHHRHPSYHHCHFSTIPSNLFTIISSSFLTFTNPFQVNLISQSFYRSSGHHTSRHFLFHTHSPCHSRPKDIIHHLPSYSSISPGFHLIINDLSIRTTLSS